MLKMKAQLEKNKRKLILNGGRGREQSGEAGRERRPNQRIARESQHLELEQNLGFAELRHSTSPMISVGSFGHEQAEATMEEDTMEQHSKHSGEQIHLYCHQL
jgi:hypothetical protein